MDSFLIEHTESVFYKKINFSVLLFEKNHDKHLSSGVLHYYEESLLTTVFASVSGLFIAMKMGK